MTVALIFALAASAQPNTGINTQNQHGDNLVCSGDQCTVPNVCWTTDAGYLVCTSATAPAQPLPATINIRKIQSYSLLPGVLRLPAPPCGTEEAKHTTVCTQWVVDPETRP